MQSLIGELFCSLHNKVSDTLGTESMRANLRYNSASKKKKRKKLQEYNTQHTAHNNWACPGRTIGPLIIKKKEELSLSDAIFPPFKPALYLLWAMKTRSLFFSHNRHVSALQRSSRRRPPQSRSFRQRSYRLSGPEGKESLSFS